MKNFIPGMNDRELDDLFRKAAEESARSGKGVPAHQEEVWKNLQQKLDAPSTGRRRRKPGWWIFSAVFLLGILGFLIWQHDGSMPGKQVKQPAAVSKIKNEGQALSSSKIISGKENDQVKAEKPIEKTKSAQVTEDTKSTAPILKSYSPSRIATDPFASHSLPYYIEKGDRSVNKERFKFKAPLLPLEKLPVQLPDIFQNVRDIPISEESLTYFEDNLHFSKKDTSVLETNPKTKKTPDTLQLSHWNLGITLGPDWNGVSDSRWRTGVGGGLKITYRLNSKWAFSTGVLLEKKLYDAKPGDYDPPDSGWMNYDVRRINASCMVWDVPLNVEYTLWSHKRSHIFLSTGLSSFWMHEEEYTYHYKTTSGDWKEWTKEMYNKNHHIFSILNFSAGYGKSWEHFSLQVSPYIKVPLKGIGYGRVKLYSTGVHFTLQYGVK